MTVHLGRKMKAGEWVLFFLSTGPWETQAAQTQGSSSQWIEKVCDLPRRWLARTVCPL